VSICVRAGLPKPRPVPDTERTKDTKTLDYASTPLDANTVLPPVRFHRHFIVDRLCRPLIKSKRTGSTYSVFVSAGLWSAVFGILNRIIIAQTCKTV